MKEQRHERRSHPSCLRPVGGDRPHAASGIRLARGLGRRRQPQRKARRARHFSSARTHGVQGHQAAHRAPDRRGDRGGRRRSQRRDQRRKHRLLRPRAQGRRAARARRAVGHSVRADLRSGGIAARAERDRAGNRRHRRRARRSGVRAPARNRVSRAADRPLHSRHAGNRALVQSGAAARLSRAQLSRARHAGGRRRRGRA